MVTNMALKPDRLSAGLGAGRTSKIYRTTLVISVGIVTALAVQSAGTRLLARRAPDLALKFGAEDSIALSTKAGTTLNQGLSDPGKLAQARRYAERAIARDMTRDDAFFVLAATTSGQNADKRATPLVRQAENLSRRNFATQLWLIEDAVRRGSAIDALVHFDTALRTNKSASATLFPVLRSALNDPNLVDPIAHTLNRAPWRGQFLQYAISLNQPNIALARVVARQRGLEPFQGTDLKALLVTQLVAVRSYDAAARLALGTAAGLVQNPDFATAAGYPPFSWQLTDIPELAARLIREGTRSKLQVQATEGAQGIVASQLLHAEPGRYILSAAMAGDAPGLSLQLRCADDDREVATMPIARNRAIAVSVPSGCRYQRLNIVLSTTAEGSGEWQLTRVDLSPN